MLIPTMISFYDATCSSCSIQFPSTISFWYPQNFVPKRPFVPGPFFQAHRLNLISHHSKNFFVPNILRPSAQFCPNFVNHEKAKPCLLTSQHIRSHTISLILSEICPKFSTTKWQHKTTKLTLHHHQP